MPTVSSGDELLAAVDNASSGDEILAEPGTYGLNRKLRVTTPNVTIRAQNDAARGEGSVTHLRGSGNVGEGGLVELRDDNIVFRGFEVSNSGFKGIEINGDAVGVEVAHVDVHDCYVWGVMTNSGRDHVIRDSYSHDNRGNAGNADGFNGTDSDGCTFLRCWAWNNADDGFDMWSGTNHTLRECWSWNNGPAGNAEFKLGKSGGGGGHLVENCVAHSSDFIGFSWNQTPNPITVRNCTAWNCSPDFRFEDAEHTLENNISADNSTRLLDGTDESNNTWNLGIDDPQFESTDPGSSGFLRLAAGSPCIGAGLDGSDLGALPYVDGDGGGGTNLLTVEGTTTLPAAAAERTTTPLETEHSGFNGEGYANFEADAGAAIRWPLEVAAAGQYNYEIRYAHGGSNDRVATMSAGDSQGEITFPQTGGWVNWSTLTGTVDLPSGTTELGIETTGDDAGNVDQIILDPIETDDGTSGGATEPSSGTANQGYNIPDAGRSDWHVPLNENFKAIDRDVPVVDREGALEEYDAAKGTLYVAVDTGTVYVGDGTGWNRLGALQ